MMEKCSTDQHKDGIDSQEQFMARVHEKLGYWVLPRVLDDIALEDTP